MIQVDIGDRYTSVYLGGEEFEAIALDSYMVGDDIIEGVINYGLDFEEFPGVLMDSFVIYNATGVDVCGFTEKYVFIVETYLTEYTSEQVIFGTDDDDFADTLINDLRRD